MKETKRGRREEIDLQAAAGKIMKNADHILSPSLPLPVLLPTEKGEGRTSEFLESSDWKAKETVRRRKREECTEILSPASLSPSTCHPRSSPLPSSLAQSTVQSQWERRE